MPRLDRATRPARRHRIVAAAAASAAAILAAATAACAGITLPQAPIVTPANAPTPTPVPAASAGANGGGGAWPEALTFATNGLTGTMTVILPNAGGRNECTGRNSRAAGRWASTLTGNVGDQLISVVATVDSYRGPAGYRNPAAVVQVRSLSSGSVWQSAQGDPVTFSVANDEESGSVDATLTSTADGTTKLKLGGTWSCRT